MLPIPLRKELFLNIQDAHNPVRANYEDAHFRQIVLFAGRLVAQKDLPTLLNAIPLVLAKQPQTLFCIVGDGPLKKQLQHQAGQLQITRNIVFVGEVAQKDMPLYYRACTVFVLSSAYEDTARVLAEAALSSRPIVTTDTTGSRDIVSEGENGFVTPLGNPSALAEKLLLLLSDEGLAQRFGENGRKRVIEKFDDNKIVEGIIMMWGRACANNG